MVLTDGHPVKSNIGTILQTVRSKNAQRPQKAAIFALGLGRNADMQFLEKLALQVIKIS